MEQNSVTVNDVNLLKAFVGNNSDKFLSKWGIEHDDDYNATTGKVVKPTINWFAFLFGVFYLGYRKLYKEVAIYSLVTVVISSLLSLVLENIIFFDIVSWVIVGVLFNSYYLDKATRKIRGINNLTYEEAEHRLSKSGGTSVGGVFIAFGILVVITYIIALVFLPFS